MGSESEMSCQIAASHTTVVNNKTVKRKNNTEKSV